MTPQVYDLHLGVALAYPEELSKVSFQVRKGVGVTGEARRLEMMGQVRVNRRERDAQPGVRRAVP